MLSTSLLIVLAARGTVNSLLHETTELFAVLWYMKTWNALSAVVESCVFVSCKTAPAARMQVVCAAEPPDWEASMTLQFCTTAKQAESCTHSAAV